MRDEEPLSIQSPLHKTQPFVSQADHTHTSGFKIKDANNLQFKFKVPKVADNGLDNMTMHSFFSKAARTKNEFRGIASRLSKVEEQSNSEMS